MPTITLQPNETSGFDTYLSSTAPSNNYGTLGSIFVGELDTAPSAVTRSLIKFDLSSIPSNALITTATLSLMISANYSNTPRYYNLYRVLRDWVESQATWNAWKTGNSWTTAGAGGNGTDVDYDTVLASTYFASTLGTGAVKEFSLAPAEFKKFVDGTYPNYGWLIKANVELDDGYAFLSSSETNAVKRPKLVVEYTLPAPNETFLMFL